jgi:hypothetical protein
MTIEPGQDDISFSKQVQRWVADKLRVPVTEHSWLAKDAFLMALDWQQYAADTFAKKKTSLELERCAVQLRAADCLASHNGPRMRLGELLSIRLAEVRSEGYVTLGQKRYIDQTMEHGRAEWQRFLPSSWRASQKVPPRVRDLTFQGRAADLHSKLRLVLTPASGTMPPGPSQKPESNALRDVDYATATGDDSGDSESTVESARLQLVFEP